jgi:hypothetical protein
MADGRGGIDSGRWDMNISRADGEERVCHCRFCSLHDAAARI